MIHPLETIRFLVEHNQALAYFIIFVGIVFEGEFFVITTGILAHLGALNYWFALGFILAGGVAKTFLGYYIGSVIYRKWCKTRFIKYIEKRVQYYLPHFQRKPFWSIFLSKFILGANHLVIIFSGFHKVEYRKFLQAEFLSTIIWGPGLLSLGYFFSYTAFHISHEVWRFSLLILIFVAIFIILDKTLGWLYQFFEEIYGNARE